MTQPAAERVKKLAYLKAVAGSTWFKQALSPKTAAQLYGLVSSRALTDAQLDTLYFRAREVHRVTASGSGMTLIDD